MPCVLASFCTPSPCSTGTSCHTASALYTWSCGVYPCQVLVKKGTFIPRFFFFFFLRAPLILDCSVLFTILCGNPFKQGGHVRYFPLPFTYFFFHAAQYLPWVLMVLVFKHHLFSIQHTVLASGTGCQNVEGNGRMLTMWFLFHAALNSERCTHPWSKC